MYHNFFLLYVAHATDFSLFYDKMNLFIPVYKGASP